MSSINASALDMKGLRVLVTGHTGFKGAWLCEWLLQSGAIVTGIALPEEPDSLFSALRHKDRLNHVVCDIRDVDSLTKATKQADPEVIFHLAAQALVRRSYREPLLTWETNVLGTLNVAEAARSLRRAVSLVAVTTDKVYKEQPPGCSYTEDDELGGHDPYSASKAACELAVASWRLSFGAPDGVTVVTARAGNVIGGGDWSEDRLVPDCFRAWRRGESVRIRRPASTRPWQHVLEPLSGYLALAGHIRSHGSAIETCNFGPETASVRSVENLVSEFARLGPSRRWIAIGDDGPHEATNLSLSIERAREILGWTPRLSFEETAAWTDAGYVAQPDHLPRVVERQIADYEGLRSS